MSIPHSSALRADALSLADDFDELLDQLLNGPAFRCGELPAPPPAPGVYLFAEGDHVLHVGRTRNLQKRRQNQTALKGSRNSATHAFRRATADATADGCEVPSNREAREKHKIFVPYFEAAKKRLRACDFRCVELEDPPRQAMFEVVASIAVGLPRDLWKTH